MTWLMDLIGFGAKAAANDPLPRDWLWSIQTLNIDGEWRKAYVLAHPKRRIIVIPWTRAEWLERQWPTLN